MNGKELTVRQRLSSKKFKNAIANIAPEGLNVDRHVTTALDTLRNNLKDGQNLHPMSILNSVYNAASMGLSFNVASKEAHLVAYGNMCVLVPGYKGYQKLCKNAGMKDMTSKVIYSNDVFDFEEVDGKFSYKYSPCLDENIGNPKAVLTVAYMEDGTVKVMVHPWHKILKRRNSAKTKKVWDSWLEEMAQKTGYIIHCNQLPQSFTSPELQNAVKMGEMFDAGKPILDTPEALKDMEDEDYQDIVNNLNNDNQPQSTKPSVSIDDIEEIPEADLVEEEGTGQISPMRDQSKTTNMERILKLVDVEEEALIATVEAEFGYKDINSLSAAKVSEIVDFFVGGE